jgi:hypothetical protein
MARQAGAVPMERADHFVVQHHHASRAKNVRREPLEASRIKRSEFPAF